MHISTNEGEKSKWNKVLAPYNKFIVLCFILRHVTQSS